MGRADLRALGATRPAHHARPGARLRAPQGGPHGGLRPPRPAALAGDHDDHELAPGGPGRAGSGRRVRGDGRAPPGDRDRATRLGGRRGDRRAGRFARGGRCGADRGPAASAQRRSLTAGWASLCA